VLRFPIISALTALGMLTAGLAVVHEPMSDVQVREAVIRESVAAYLADGHACAYPYNVARNRSTLAPSGGGRVNSMLAAIDGKRLR
jgi:hypothetical protein